MSDSEQRRVGGFYATYSKSEPDLGRQMSVKNGAAEEQYLLQSLGLRSPRPSWNCLNV